MVCASAIDVDHKFHSISDKSERSVGYSDKAIGDKKNKNHIITYIIYVCIYINVCVTEMHRDQKTLGDTIYCCTSNRK